LSQLRVSPSEEMFPKLVAAAGVARVTAILDGMHQIRGRPEIASVLMRSLCDTWVQTVYLLYGGTRAFRALSPATAAEVAKLTKKWRHRKASQLEGTYRWLGMTKRERRVFEAGGTVVKKGKALGIADIAKRAGRLLGRRHKGGLKLVQAVYKRPYATTSLFATHSNLASIGPYLGDGSLPMWQLELRPVPRGSKPAAELYVAAKLQIDLLAMVLDEAKYHGQEVADLRAALTAAKPTGY
jgi:hypothetical protein